MSQSMNKMMHICYLLITEDIALTLYMLSTEDSNIYVTIQQFLKTLLLQMLSWQHAKVITLQHRIPIANICKIKCAATFSKAQTMNNLMHMQMLSTKDVLLWQYANKTALWNPLQHEQHKIPYSLLHMAQTKKFNHMFIFMSTENYKYSVISLTVHEISLKGSIYRRFQHLYLSSSTTSLGLCRLSYMQGFIHPHTLLSVNYQYQIYIMYAQIQCDHFYFKNNLQYS